MIINKVYNINVCNVFKSHQDTKLSINSVHKEK